MKIVSSHRHRPRATRVRGAWINAVVAGVLLTTIASCRPDPAAHRDAKPVPRNSDEVWEAHFIEGQQVGHGTTRLESLQEEGRTLTKISSTTEMAVRRFGTLIAQRIDLVSIEEVGGGLVRFESRMVENGSTTMKTVGRFSDGQLLIETTTLGKTEKTAIPWRAGDGGLFADRQSLRRRPLRVGERRSIRGLIPILTIPGEIRLVGEEMETVELLSESRELLRVTASLEIGTTTIKTTYWIDEAGETFKTMTSFSGFEQTAYRVSKEEALRASPPGDFDLGMRSLVSVDQQIAEPHKSQVAVYRVELTEGDPKQVFGAGPNQRVDRIDSHIAEITVVAVRPDQPDAVGESSSPGPADLEASNMIQSDDRRVIAMAAAVLPDEEDPWKVACGLEQFVHSQVTSRSFSQSLASAAEVARDLEGDCTEHAVLLAALCRARKIPARISVGLVYSRREEGFAYHMWNEVWVTDRWIPMDATLGLGGIGAAHLTVMTSDFSGATPYGVLLPVFDVLGKLKIKIVSVE